MANRDYWRPTALSAQDPVTFAMSNNRKTKAKSGVKDMTTNDRAQLHPWQAKVEESYRSVGELRYIIDTIAARTAQAEFKYVRPKGVKAADFTKACNKLPVEVFTKLIRPMATLIQLEGEGFLIHLQNKPNLWNVVPRALTVVANKGEVIGQNGAQIPLVEPAYRIYRADALNPWNAASMVEAAIPVLDALYYLTMQMASDSKSRLASAGLLVLSQGIKQSFSPDPSHPEQTFEKALIDAMIAEVRNPGDPSAAVPSILVAPDEDVRGSVMYEALKSESDTTLVARLEELVKRVARISDVPPEVLLGNISTNHWNAWLSDKQFVDGHITPLNALICEQVASVVFADQVEIQHDESGLIATINDVDSRGNSAYDTTKDTEPAVAAPQDTPPGNKSTKTGNQAAPPNMAEAKNRATGSGAATEMRKSNT